ncbi:MAG: hypothetical protein ACR2MD_00710, partial [Aridibacter sp.]
MKIKEAKSKIGFTRFTIAVISALMCGAIFLGGTSFIKAAPDSSLSPQTKREIAIARQATARYHNINHAIADGYASINFCLPNMGCHYARPETPEGGFDAVFDPARPELLVYT